MRLPLKNPPDPSLRFSVPGWGFFGKHAGIDYPVGKGTPVYSPGLGTIRSATIGGDGTKVIEIAIGQYWHRFLHLDSFARTSGTVAEGELIGYSGATGPVTGPHLHWDVRKAGTLWTDAYLNYIDPLELIKEEPMGMSPGTVENVYLAGWRRNATAAEHKRWDGTDMGGPAPDSLYYTGIQPQLEWLWKQVDARDKRIKELEAQLQTPDVQVNGVPYGPKG